MLTYASVCDGIGAAHVAWQPLGYRCVWTSEIEQFPAAVVEHHWHLPNLGDMTQITEADIERHGPIDLLVGGTPCQSFSVAGLRKGLDDQRGNLALRFLQLACATRARWLVWENVPGVLSSGGGRDFGTFLGALVELGYGFAYRVLDAQYFGVPQRRRRVFVVGHLGDWRRAAAVLFERACLSGNPPPSREAGKGITHSTSPCIGASGRGFERAGETRGQDPVVAVAGTLGSNHGNIKAEHAWTGQLLPFQNTGQGWWNDRDVAATLRDGDGKGGGENRKANLVAYGGGNTQGPIAAAAVNAGGCKRLDFDSETLVTHSLRADGFDASEDGTGRGTPLVPMAFDCKQSGEGGEVSPPLRALNHSQSHANAGGQVAVNGSAGVRRLTPRECERLQGFPDDYTAIEYRGKPAADGPRYKALGNSMAVPVMTWIGRRILEVEQLHDRPASD